MKKLAYLCSLLVLLTSLNCSTKDDNPLATDGTNNSYVNVLFYDSFEENGIGSLHGWSYYDSSYNKYFSFSTDVPNNSSKYSLCIENDSVSGPYIFRILKNQSTVHQRILVFDFWAKGEGGTLLSVEIAFNDSVNGFSLLMNTDTQWRHVVDTLRDELNPYSPNSDSLRIIIGGVNYNPNRHKIFLDEFKITELTSQ